MSTITMRPCPGSAALAAPSGAAICADCLPRRRVRACAASSSDVQLSAPWRPVGGERPHLQPRPQRSWSSSSGSSSSGRASRASRLRSLGCRAASSESEAAAVDQEGVLLEPPAPGELDRDQQWIATMVCAWLDEEWTPLDVHARLGDAAGAAYVRCRQAGDNDMGSLVLGLANELLGFNYRDTFVNAFEVANKVVEMLMMRDGVPVCCTTDEDAERLEHFRPPPAGTDSSSVDQF